MRRYELVGRRHTCLGTRRPDHHPRSAEGGGGAMDRVARGETQGETRGERGQAHGFQVRWRP